MFAKLNPFPVVRNTVRAFASSNKILESYAATLDRINTQPASSSMHIQSSASAIIDQFDIHFYDALRDNVCIKNIGQCSVNIESALVTTTMRSFPLLGTYIEAGGKAKRPIPYAIITPVGTIPFLDLKSPDRVSTKLNHASMQWIEHQWMSVGLFRCHFGEYIVYAERASVANIDEILMPRAKILNEGTPELIKLYKEVIEKGVKFTDQSVSI